MNLTARFEMNEPKCVDFDYLLEHSQMMRIYNDITYEGIFIIFATVTTISLFLCGIPICLDIWTRKDSKEISSFPFFIGFVGGAFWFQYGICTADLNVILINAVGVTLMLCYLLWFIYYTKSRKFVLLELLISFLAIIAMLVCVNNSGTGSNNLFGKFCLVLNVISFGAPLAGLKIVYRNKSCKTLPLPLCLANLLVSAEWCAYGLFVKNDSNLIIPNSLGMVLAVVQLSLFLIFPRRVGSKAPMYYICNVGTKSNKSEKTNNKTSEIRKHSELLKKQWLINGLVSSRHTFHAGGNYIYDKTSASNSAIISSISDPALWNLDKSVNTLSDDKKADVDSSNSSISSNYWQSSHAKTLFNKQCPRNSSLVFMNQLQRFETNQSELIIGKFSIDEKIQQMEINNVKRVFSTPRLVL